MSERVAMICKAAVAITSVGCAAFLAYHGKEGWGWLVGIALISSTWTYSD